MHVRHTIVRLVILLALGFVANMLVTAVLAATVNVYAVQRVSAVAPVDAWRWQVSLTTTFGTARVHSQYETGVSSATMVKPAERVPSWAPVTREPPSDVTMLLETFEARGWPALSSWCRTASFRIPIVGQPQAASRISGGVELPLSPWLGSTGRPHPRVVPILPIWTGLVINTIFYAMVMALVALVLHRFLLVRRYERGRCPRCGYQMMLDYRNPCPECGRRPRRANGA